MRILNIVSGAAVLALCFNSQNGSAQEHRNKRAEAELKHIAQQLFDAVAVGDKAVWAKYLAEECVYTDEEGHTKTKAELLKEISPLPKGIVGSGVVENVIAKDFDTTGILVYDIRETEELFGQHLETRYRNTDTYLKTKAGWKLIASQTQVLPKDPPIATVRGKPVEDYAGTYKLAPDMVYVVALMDGRLTASRNGRPPAVLVPVYQDVFFIEGRNGLFVF